jgi:hypothetical protein
MHVRVPLRCIFMYELISNAQGGGGEGADMTRGCVLMRVSRRRDSKRRFSSHACWSKIKISEPSAAIMKLGYKEITISKAILSVR